MKNLISITTLFTFSVFSAQVAIGKQAVNGNSTILDFAETDNYKGIILPAVEQAPATLGISNNGTFLLDRNDKKVKMFENNKWVNLSQATGNVTNITVNTTADQGNGAIIGSGTTNALGVLVLESDNKAMILPKVFRPDINVRSPHAGMICYDTFNKMIAVFDGSVWNFWR